MTYEEIINLKEDFDIEFKKANGEDGKGKLPKEFWPTYSAMANTHGGTVFLGIKENTDKSLEIIGIDDILKIKKELFDLLNNTDKISMNLLTDSDIEEININGKNILKVNIPQATRQQKPIFVSNNPLMGTYKRNFEGDYKCTAEEIKRMLVEQIEDTRDNKILEGYNFADVSEETFHSYRQAFARNKPEHPWNDLNDKDFLRSIGGWKTDRKSNTEGLTLAGLLMFGELPSILDALPYYMVDYQERPEAKTEARWIDRITVDGTWSGNLYDFYKKVIRKLYSDLKVPFQLDDDVRKDSTIVHTSLREALINSISHADYSGRVSLLVVKRPDMFGFRNPGLMRVPIDVAIKGGESDCRNRTIHQMFLLIGLGERAGSGLPKIFSGWSSQHWSKPLLYEKNEPEQTLLELRMINLLDDKVIDALTGLFGERMKTIDENSRVILATAFLEKVVNHNRLNEIIDAHSHDITLTLKNLVSEGYLSSEGNGRGKVYFLPNMKITKPQDFTFEAFTTKNGTPDIKDGTPDIKDGTPDIKDGTPDIKDGTPDIKDNTIKILKSIEELTKEELLEYQEKAKNVSQKQRISNTKIVEDTIVKLCEQEYMSLELLSKLLNRSGESLRKQYLNPLVKSGRLMRAFATTPNHPKQAYKKV